MSGIKPRLVRSLKESDTHWVEELDSVLWGLRTTPNRTTGYTPFVMVYDAYCPATSFMTHLECACTKRKKPSLIGRTVWMPWRRSVMWQKPTPHSISKRLNGIKAEKYGPKLITLVNSFYAYQRRKRTSSSPNGKALIIDKVLTGGAYRLRDASDNRLEPNPWNTAKLRRFYA